MPILKRARQRATLNREVSHRGGELTPHGRWAANGNQQRRGAQDPARIWPRRQREQHQRILHLGSLEEIAKLADGYVPPGEDGGDLARLLVSPAEDRLIAVAVAARMET